MDGVQEETMQKKAIRLVLLTLVGVMVAGVGFAQETEQTSFLGEWESEFANPTYGFAVLPVQIVSIANGEFVAREDIFAGIDLRIFSGVNVARRGGFYNGIEAGVQLFGVESEELPFADQTPDENAYDVSVAPVSGALTNVFVLAKYGYRLDLGIGIIGASLGAELGVGARMSTGTLALAAFVPDGVDPENTTYYVEKRFGADAAINVVVDSALEAAVRLGRNFRIVGRLGAMFTPPLFTGDHGETFLASGEDGPTTIGDAADADAWLSQYTFVVGSFIPTLRVGFILNY